MTMAERIKVIHYLNPFFAGLGGEERSGIAPCWFAGVRGPGRLVEREARDLEIVATVVAGDDFMAGDIDAGAEQVCRCIESEIGKLDTKPQLLIAGPAFGSGRYGMACAAVCRVVQQRLGIPAVTSLHPDNPAVELYRAEVTIVRAAPDVMGMREAILGMVRVARKLLRNEPVVPSADDTISKGLRQNYFAPETGARRAIEMLMRRLGEQPFETEYPLPVFDRVPPAEPVPDLRNATVAVVTSGGIVPRGNPDRIESASASRFGAYSIAGLDRLSSETHQSVHGGYDPTYANADPNRVLPLDALRALERSGRIGRLHETYYATVGNATSVKRAVRFGEEIAAMLVNVGVLAVVLTST